MKLYGEQTWLVMIIDIGKAVKNLFFNGLCWISLRCKFKLVPVNEVAYLQVLQY